jgi:hypothetical protein
MVRKLKFFKQKGDFVTVGSSGRVEINQVEGKKRSRALSYSEGGYMSQTPKGRT